MKKKYDILLVEDNEGDIRIIKELFKEQSNLTFCITCAGSLEEATQCLTKFTFDTILLDLGLPDSAGIGTFLSLNKRFPSLVTTIIFTGLNDIEIGLIAVNNGAQDYIIKGQLDSEKLVKSIIYSFERSRLTHELKTQIEARRAMEEELSISLVKYKTLFENLPLGINVSDDTGNILEANPMAEKLLGLSQDEQKQRLIDGEEWQIIRSDGTPMPIEEYASVRALRDRYVVENVEMGIVKPNNIITWINVTAAPIPLKGYGVVITYNNISKRKLAEETVLKERIMLRTLIDNLPAQIYILDKEGRKVVGNKADIDNIGCNSETEIIGKNDLELFPGDIGIRGHTDNISVIESEIPIIDHEEYFFNKEGQQRWLLTSKYPLRDNYGNVIGLVGIGHDITERKKILDALNESYEFNNSLLNTIPFGMHIVDETGNILFQSNNFSKIFGPEAIGKKCWELYRDDKKQCTNCPLFAGITIGVTKSYESYGVLGGKIYLISHTGMLFQGKKAMLEIFQDITERKLNEIELGLAIKKAEENDKLKTSFLHNISHEIRTPLNAIVGFSALLSEPDLIIERQKSFVEIINQSSDHLLAIVSDIVEFSNIEAGILKFNKNEINLNKIMNDLYLQFSQVTSEKKLEFRFVPGLSDTEANIMTDMTKLTQILSNLLNNSIKFTDHGMIDIGYCLKGTFIEFYISDSGVGIPEDQFTKIFDRFYQVEHSETRLYEGTGLGLSICKAYVEFMGGEIWVTSETGKGSKFYFTVPYEKIKKQKPSEHHVISGNNPETNVTKTVLIAEDDENNFKLVLELLAGNNIKIIRAKNGAEAIEICNSKSIIDLVLMDIKMPDIDGYEATKQIKKYLPDLPVVALTAYASEMDKNKAFSVGFSNFITKPYTGESLISIVNEYILK